MNEYPMLHFIVRFGQPIAIVLALVIAVAGIWATATGASVAWALLGVGAGVICYGLVLSYVELVKLVMDMLLPK